MAYPEYITKEPVVLDGFQSIFVYTDPNKSGKPKCALQCLVGEELMDLIEQDRVELLPKGKAQVPEKQRKKATEKPPSWEEVDEQPGFFRLKFSWEKQNKPVIVDAQGTAITDDSLKVFSGSTVRVSFFQKPYGMNSGDYGTSLKLLAIQIISIGDGSKRVSAEQAASQFGAYEGGFVVDEEEPDETEEGVPAEDSEF